jgi:membrane fusion protein (multidrug efflux system)
MTIYYRFVKHRVILILPYLVIAALLTGCGQKKENTTEAPEKFQVITPLLLDTIYTKEYVAEIQSVRNVEVRAMVKGIIEKVHVDEGMTVTAGQLLFTISSRQYQEDLLKANAQLKTVLSELKTAELEVQNTKRLVDKNIISKTELENAQAKKDAVTARIEEATSGIAVAKLNLSYAQVKAPFSGTINRVPNKAGSVIEEGALLTTISDNNEVYAYFNVGENEYLDFSAAKEQGKRTEVSLLLSNNRPFKYKGVIETIENEIEKSTGNIAFRARFSNPEHLLKHGSSGKILMNSKLSHILVVPQKSTFEVQDKLNVYVVDGKNTVHIKSFVPGLRIGDLYIVSSGLTAGDKIVFEGVQLLKEGQVIAPETVDSRQTINRLVNQ